ncbi:hypothetical protein P7M68_24610, partial [Vibrio parahaemolyticus]|nr:hypothetical protein [Vibrio parahaemolyticus]
LIIRTKSPSTKLICSKIKQQRKVYIIKIVQHNIKAFFKDLLLGSDRCCCASRTRCLTRLTRPWCIIPASDKSLWRLTLSPISAGSNPHNMRVDSTRNTVLHLHIEFRKRVLFIDTSLLNISDCSLFNNVPHQKPLDSLVLRTAFAAVGASNELDVATAVFVATSIPALECHGRWWPELARSLFLLSRVL